MNARPNPDTESLSGLKQSAVEFVAARLELFAFEARIVTRAAAIKALYGLIALMCLVFIWLGSVTALVGWITAVSGIPWYGVTFLAVLAHLAIAAVSVAVIRRGTIPFFPHTRDELLKDRTWLQSLKKR